MNTSEIRKTFLKYFEDKGHQQVESSSLVPHGDPTLLFTNAGMNQFKDVFLGLDKRSYSRATTSQKCVRAGGKHNDLENVGFTARHHTFFEMLGNFSFGDYFKKEAIQYAWELVTVKFGLPKDRLYVTVHTTDDEAEEIWHNQEGVPKDRISRFDEDNFWQMGETGPCGPCSEIFFDYGPEVGCQKPDCKVGCECDRFVEIWNLVFMQYNKDDKGTLNPLPKPSVDTGMGLERIASVMQGKTSNYQIDLFQKLISAIDGISKKNFGEDSTVDPSFQVISDHLRASTFLIADGILPSNEGRGYVLRRIIRRAVRHGKNLGIEGPFFSKLTGTLMELMGDAYPELLDKKSFVDEVLNNEESKFLETLDRGLSILQENIDESKSKGDKQISGSTAFKLYDTFGFPPDLTDIIAGEQGFSVDHEGFEKEMAAQRERSGKFKGSGEVATGEGLHQLYSKLKDEYGEKPVEFTGYSSLEEKNVRVIGLLYDGEEVEKVAGGSDVIIEVVVDKTPFYGESGGQVGDRGTMTFSDGSQHEILDTQKPFEGFFVHRVHLGSNDLSWGQEVSLKVDGKRRNKTIRNHSATHLLHSALRKNLGDHIKQAGSLVTPDRLRFDYTHFQGTSAKELSGLESEVNEKISSKIKADVEELAKDDALKKGAVAFFGDKYGDVVRVVTMSDYSVEFCGGTHVGNTSDIGVFKIVSEQSIASGVRRIEAVTGSGVLEYFKKQDEKLLNETEARLGKLQTELQTALSQLTDKVSKDWSASLKRLEEFRSGLSVKLNSLTMEAEKILSFNESGLSSDDPKTSIDTANQKRVIIKEEINSIEEESKTLLKTVQKELKKLKSASLSQDADSWISMAKNADLNGVPAKVLIQTINDTGAKELRDLPKIVLPKLGSGVFIIVGSDEGKAIYLVSATKDIVRAGFHAGNLIKETAPLIDGRGGGKPDMAQAGGTNPSGISELISKIESILLK